MKTKGISVIERHGEKAVVGAFALLALGVVAWQFVGAGNRVTIDSNNKVEPDRAYDSIVRRAEQITGQLNDPNPAAGIPETLPDAAELVRQRIARGLNTPSDSMTPLGVAASPFGQTRRLDAPEDARYAAIEPPAPLSPVVAQYLLTLDPLAVATVPSLAQVATSSQPHDLRAVSVEATFPAAEFRAMLEADPDGSGPLSALPRTFWLNRTAILGVRLERQRISADGTLGPVEAVPASPGSLSFLDALAPGMSPGEFQTATRDARQNIAAVVQPAFPPSIAGDIWQPPTALASARPAAVQGDDITNLLNRRANFERNLEIERARQGSITNEQARQASAARVARLETEIQNVNQRLFDLGFGAQRANTPAQTTTAEGAALPEPRNIESAEDIVLVAHDLTGEPGATYRYRVRVGMANPFFPVAQTLQEDQRGLAEEPVVLSEPSEWSDPIRVAPQAQAFVTRAAGGQDAVSVGGFRIGDITAEMFGLFFGHWRGSTVRLNPGDALATTVTLPEGLSVYEILEAGDDGSPPTLGAPTPLPSAQPVALEGAMLLDVIDRSAGSAGSSAYLAVLRLPDGRLALRDPAADLQNPALTNARRSAQAGQGATPQAPRSGAPGGAQRPTTRPTQPARPQQPGTRID